MTMSRMFHPPARLLLGPGPSNVDGRVLQAMSAPMIGYFDPSMPELTGEISRLLRLVFGTTHAMTLPVEKDLYEVGKELVGPASRKLSLTYLRLS